MLSFSLDLSSSLIATVSIPIPLPEEYKAKLEAEFTQFTNYYVTLFAVMALVFVVKGIVS